MILRVGAVLGLLAVLLALEHRAALRARRRPWVGRLLINAGVSALAFVTASAIVRPAALWTLNWSSGAPFGVIHLAAMPVVAQFAIAFLLMDLTFYWWHVANHRVPFLWRFHNVHHIDPDLDVTTAFRFHFGEVALSSGFRVVQVAMIGLPAWMFVAYEAVFQANTLFHHSNLRLPIGLERALCLVLVTPRMHGIHHSQVRGETNSNYSVVFSWWDRLHRTLGLNVPQSALVIGVPAYADPSDNTLRSALAMPFRAQRDYWQQVDGRRLDERPETLEGKRSWMAE